MLFRVSSKTWLLTLACIALLLMRIGGAHLHLCFDGSEPASSLHFSDAGHHADHHGSQQHDDRDVSLVGDTIVKLGKLNVDLPLLFLALLAFGLLSLPRSNTTRGDPVLNSINSLWFLHPPLRGPPALAS